MPSTFPRRPHLAACALVLMLAVAGPASAWGPLGHRLVALLAWDELDPRARADIAELLRGEPDPTLAGIATWADELRANDPDLGKRSARWHYVNLGEHDCAYDRALACADGDCAVEAIRRQAAILADASQPRAARVQALKFVVHFVGDVHQPMHGGYARDKGGNDIQVRVPDGTAEGKGGNLHSLWDSGLLRTAGLDEPAYLARLRALPLAIGLEGDAAQWAEASCRIAVQAYPARPKIEDAYVSRWLPVAEAQLRRGGTHLALVLNGALAR